MRQLLYCQRKGLSATEDGITCQQHDGPGELCVALRLEVPGLQVQIIVLPRTNLRLPMEGHSFAIAKPIDDRDCGAVLSAGIVPDVDDDPVQFLEVSRNLVQSGSQLPFLDACQLEDADVAERAGPAVMQHPRPGLGRPSETIGGKRLRRRLEELLDLWLAEFLPEFGLAFRIEVSLLPVLACFCP